ncbi:MAG: UDP-N-acetylmuramate:L-alanyl-gamma-D-glutamyl-meso-diaminopimelate ligase, partial [Gammaproteobacteria bacterium]
IELTEGYAREQLDPVPDVVVVGNVMTRGVPVVEELLDRGIAYASGPEWLAREVLPSQRVIAVAGTHGKTTTASLLAHILERAGMEPGFLIGGIPCDFDISARFGGGSLFVIEADEYDTAFFDKRAKFLHYRPEIQVINNLEFDHADIYQDLAAIQNQFHQLVRALPSQGRLIVPAADEALRAVLDRGCWTPLDTFSSDPAESADWTARDRADGTLELFEGGESRGSCRWTMTGAHNAENAVAAFLAARAVGVPANTALAAIGDFRGVRRRLERRGAFGGVVVYDDFAHHPTAIRRTISGIRRQMSGGRLIIVLEPRSNSMKLGIHRDTLGPALAGADRVWVYRPPGLAWDIAAAVGGSGAVSVCDDTENIVREAAHYVESGDRLIVMSNGGFDGLHERLEAALASRFGIAAEQ